MKFVTLATLLLFSFGTSVSAGENQELKNLAAAYVTARSEALARAARPIEDEYIAELRELKSRLSSAGRLEEAVEVREEIRKHELHTALPGEWVWADNKSKILTLRPDGIATHSQWEEEGAWIILSDNTIRLFTAHTSFDVTLSDQNDFGSVTAHDGAETTMRRKRK